LSIEVSRSGFAGGAPRCTTGGTFHSKVGYPTVNASREWMVPNEEAQRVAANRFLSETEPLG
jgi:hypothetical protein